MGTFLDGISWIWVAVAFLTPLLFGFVCGTLFRFIIRMFGLKSRRWRTLIALFSIPAVYLFVGAGLAFFSEQSKEIILGVALLHILYALYHLSGAIRQGAGAFVAGIVGAAGGLIVSALGYFAAYSLVGQINTARFSSGIPVELSADPVIGIFQTVNGWYVGEVVPFVNGLLVAASPTLSSASAYLPDIMVGVVSSLIASLLLSRRGERPWQPRASPTIGPG